MLLVLSWNCCFSVWVGGVDVVNETQWVWAGSGELLAEDMYSNWAPSQPDNYLNEEHCMELSAYSREFNDQPYYYDKQFVCEKWYISLIYL